MKIIGEIKKFLFRLSLSVCTDFSVVIWELKNQKHLTETKWDCWKRAGKISQDNCMFGAQKIQEWRIIANSKSFFSFRNQMQTKKEWRCHAERTSQDKWSFLVCIQKFHTAFDMGGLTLRKGGGGSESTELKMKAGVEVLYLWKTVW